MDGLKVRLLVDDERRELMKAPDDVSAMLRLKGLGWGSRRIAAELGCAQHSAALAGARGLAAVGVAVAVQEAGRIVGVAARAVSSPRRQRRRGSPGAGPGEKRERQSAHGRACGGAVPAGADRCGAGDGPVRDGARSTAADRFRRAPGRDRRGAEQGVPVCGHARLLAPAACAWVSARAAGELVRRAGKCVPGVRWGASRGAARQRAGADPAP